MKTQVRILSLLTLMIFLASNSLGQKVSYTTNDGWTFGVGGGKAYQNSDIAYSNGLGFDLTLGSKLYYKKNAFLGVDWKFRFLAGQNKSYDLSINTDNSISNVRYNFYSYDLELGLTLNRLRERTRIVLSGFVGAGITHGQTSTDLYDAGNHLYDYNSIDLNRDNKLVYKDLLALSDGDFETPLLNKAAVLPTAGLFIGYQISRSFKAGFEFKTNFCLTEKNSFVGINLDNKVRAGSSIDRNSYISLGFSWTLRGRNSRYRENSYSYDGTAGRINHPETKDSPQQLAPSAPSVFITDPTSDTYNTVSNTHTLWAIVTDVSGSEQISFYQNGFPNHNFSYNKSTNMFIANVDLRKGENRFRIKALNQTSAAEDLVTITLENPPEAGIPAAEIGFIAPGGSQDRQTVKPENPVHRVLPTIRFIHPADHAYVEKNLFPMKVAIQDVPGRKDVSVKLNGASIQNFSFSKSGMLTVTLFLSEGANTIEISAENEAGLASESSAITYQKPVYHIPVYSEPVIHEPVSRAPAYQEPVIQEPVTQEPVTHEPVSRAPVYQAPVSPELATRRPVTYRPGTREPVTREPVTREPVKETSPPVKSIPKPCSKPVLTLIDPVKSQSNTNQQTYLLKAEVQNIDHKNQLRLSANGNPVSFSFSNHIISSSLPLSRGMNAISLKAENECGDDRAMARINFRPSVATKPCTKPSIRINVNEVNRNETTHELRGSVSGVTNKSDISLTVNGNANFGFQFVPSTGELTAKLNLPPGSYTIVAAAKNACGSDSKSESIKIVEEAGGVRINPGNADWQFCLATPSGTFSRNQLTNSNFSYSGPATSLYFLPIGGGGEAMVNGRSYPVKSGQYYHFTGNLNVSVSTKNPGSMGHWSVLINADRVPVSGNGNKRPESPCEIEKSAVSRGKKNSR